ncbi:MAG: response regulator [Deltaproteobacteria bacterium]|nr:response regulator [Deltaproteobacteria bacterium]
MPMKKMKARDWKVLFIDDEEGIRKVMSITLADAGYKVLTAQDGMSGLEICHKDSPQIVITDIRMPNMDGIEVLKKIKEANPEREVIVVTGYGDMELAIQALQLDASDFITKPINDEALFVALERAKERYSTRKELNDYTTLMEERWMDTAEELARTFNFQENLIDSSIDGIMGCDKEGIIRTYNKSMVQMLGYPSEEVVGQMYLNQFFPLGEDDKFREYLYSEDYGGRHRLVFLEAALINRSGGKIPVQLSATVLFEEGEEMGIVGIFRDLGEIRRLEQQFADQARLLQQDKMISLGRLAASIVHEINNPLAGMLNYIRLMIKILNRGSLEQERLEKFQRYLSLIDGETERCSKIVSNLLAFSRKSRLEFNEMDVNELLEKCIMLSQHKLTLQNIQIKTDLGKKTPPVLGDFNQIQQCIINLIFNASDAMPEGGSLNIESSYDAKGRVVQIIVRDTGCGMSKDEISHIFDPFFTTKKEGKGIGLGLSTVYGIIDRHKGTISVDSELGKGSVFTIKLPVGETGV